MSIVVYGEVVLGLNIDAASALATVAPLKLKLPAVVILPLVSTVNVGTVFGEDP